MDSMNIFNFLEKSSLKVSDFNKEHKFLIDGFLPSELITMIYAAGGSGKTFLSYGITKKLCEIGKKVFYLDFDNPVSVLKERKCDELLISKFKNLNYIQRSSIEISPFELIAELEKSATKNAYEECVFILDSLFNFCDLFNDNKLLKLFDMLKNLREAGATIIVLHHTNKDGKNFQGNVSIKNAIDCMFKLSSVHISDDEINYSLEVVKERASIVDCGFNLECSTLELKRVDIKLAAMSEYELDFTNRAREILKDGKKLTKTEFLNALGFEKDDKTARDCLDKFEGKLWFSKKVGKSIFYSKDKIVDDDIKSDGCLKENQTFTTLQLRDTLPFSNDTLMVSGVN